MVGSKENYKFDLRAKGLNERVKNASPGRYHHTKLSGLEKMCGTGTSNEWLEN